MQREESNSTQALAKMALERENLSTGVHLKATGIRKKVNHLKMMSPDNH